MDILTIPGCSRTLIPVTHATRECTAFGNLRSLAHKDDLELVTDVRGWSQCVYSGNFENYKRRFEETREFFELRVEKAGKLGSEMIKAVMETEVIREEDAWGIERL